MSPNTQTDKLWPGYVAAVASLLLGLLLVAAVLAVSITQIGTVHESFYQAVNNLGRPAAAQANVPLVAGMSDVVPPRDAPATLPQAAGLEITFVEEHAEPQGEDRERIRQALNVLRREASGLRISASLPTQDFYLRREVYARLWSIRALALEVGFVAGQIEIAIDTEPQAPAPRQSITLYVLPVAP
jgi:hypothetical protein